MLPRILPRVVGWAKAHHFYGLEFEERGETVWAFIRTWEKGTFRRVAVDVVDRFTVDATHEVAVLGSVVAAVGSSASLVAISGGSRRMWWQTLTRSTWEVGTRTSWWNTRFSTCVSSCAVCRRCLPPSLGLWIPSS